VNPYAVSRYLRQEAGTSLDDAEDLSWQDDALCAETDPEAFFPEKGGSIRLPKLICSRCEVRKACLEYALDHEIRFGVWGGLSERERRRLARDRQNVTPQPREQAA
jgi:WhiB family transcriptional regulator, redox-sensing transcriptional regulator